MNGKEIHLRDYIKILLRRKRIICLFFVLAFSAVSFATFTATPYYMAKTKVMIERNFGDPLSSREVYRPYDPEFLETQTQLILSAAVIKKVVQQMNPQETYQKYFAGKKLKKSYAQTFSFWFKDQILEFWDFIGMGDGNSPALLKKSNRLPSKADQLEKFIRSGISVKLLPNTRILEIGYLCDTPELAVEVANSVAQAYIDELIDMQMEVAGYSIGWMRKKADIQRAKLEESEKALHDYKTKHDIITVEDRLAVLPERLSVLSSNLTHAETKRKELYAVYSQIANKDDAALETVSVITRNTTIDAINREIRSIEQKISELSKKYGPKHPRMITAADELRNLNDKKKQALKDAVKTIENEYLLARENEKDLGELLEQTKARAALLGERSIQLGILQRKVDTNRYLYDALIKKMEEKDITEKIQTVNVWVIEEADLPQFPEKPKKRRNLLLGLIFGIMGGVGLAFFVEYLDNTIKTPEDVLHRFGLPVLSTIVQLKGKKESVVQRVLQKTASLTTEGFKSLRTAILLSSPQAPPRKLLVTSMAPGEGKSSIAVCLAASIAQTGKKVLLIDGDMRRPVQHHYFSLEPSHGLSSCLAGVSTENAVVQSDVLENLDLMPAGPIPPNPSELLSSLKMKTVVDTYALSYDMVIIDSPPMGRVTDPVVLSKMVDGIIVVAWAGRTTYNSLEKGLKQLSDIKAPVSGLVLNRFAAGKKSYHYSYKEDYSTVQPK